MNKDDVGNLDIALVENVVSASRRWLKAAGIRDWEVASDWGCPVVVVANAVVVATTAVKVALHGIPLSSDVAVNAVPDRGKKPLRHFSHQQMQDKLFPHIIILLPEAIAN